MIRLAVLTAVLTGLVVYAFRDWYKSLCGLIVMMAFIEHPDMPKSLMGVQGFNPWNLTFAFIFLAWLINRRREGLTWDMPRGVSTLLVLYIAVVVVACLRLILTEGALANAWAGGNELGMGAGEAFSEYIVNSTKWILPGLLLFDGCRDRSRFLWGMGALLSVYLLLALQVIKWMPMSLAASGASLQHYSAKLVHRVGYHRVNLSMMLAGASWAVLAARVLTKNAVQSILVFGVAIVMVFGQALTGGRAGYATWMIVGLVLCLVRWRKLLLLMPVVVLAIVLAVPSAVERMTQGFSEDSRDTNARLLQAQQELDVTSEGPDAYTVLAGRNVAWGYVIPKIGEAPVVGYGRLGMQTSGIMMLLWTKFGESFPHPHNAYLELLLDNGVTGFVCVMAFYLVVLGKSWRLFRSKESPYYSAAGGVALALILALMVAAMGSQSFYPREGSVGMWCAIGLMLRVCTDRDRTLRESRAAGEVAVPDAPPAFVNPWLVGA